MLRSTTTAVWIRFDPNSLEPEETEMKFHIFVNTTSKLVGQELPQRRLTVRVMRKAELTLRGWVNPEQSFYSGVAKLQDTPMEMDDVGSPLVHTYWIFNEGPSVAPKVKLDIHLPLMLGSGLELGGAGAGPMKHLQYLEDRPSIEAGQGECIVAPQYVNPLNLSSRLDTNLLRSAAYLNAPASLTKWPSYRKQQLQLNKSYHHVGQKEADVGQDSSSDGRANRLPRNIFERFWIHEREPANPKGKKHQEIVELNCDKLTAQCVKIQCEFYAMPAKTEAQVIIKTRLWNSTLVAEYPRVDRVLIMSTAYVKIPDNFGVEQAENNTGIQVRIIGRCNPFQLMLILTLSPPLPL